MTPTSVQPSPLPSPPTSPTSPRAATARIRIKHTRRPDSLHNFPSHQGSADRTKRLSQPLSRIATTQVELAETRPSLVSKRRQSSIAYYTPSSPSPWSQRPQHHRTFSFGGSGRHDTEPTALAGNLKDNLSKRSSVVLSSHTSSARDSVSSLDVGAARDREPLTLVEKHADLLHYIAQKERKCLELRDQLAAHEKELAELKRKWECIVNRGYDPLPNPPLTGISGAAIDGLKEGVRIIAAGFSDLGGVIHELESEGVDSSNVKPLTNIPRQSNAFVKRADSEHRSMSSTSSRRDSMHAPNYIHDGGEEDAATVTIAPSLTRTGSLDSRMHKRASRIISKQPTPPGSMSVSPSQSPKTTSLDVGMSLILAPSPTLVPSVALAFKLPVTEASHGSVSATGPISTWMDSMGKKIGELQKGQTFIKGQKRASSLLAGVSSSITSALSPGPIATTPAPLPNISAIPPGSIKSSSPVTKRSPPSRPRRAPEPSTDSRAYPTYKSMADWLEDEEEQTVGASEVLVPASGRHTDAPVAAQRKDARGTTTASVSSFDDDWNW